jgi:hypothetical protein
LATEKKIGPGEVGPDFRPLTDAERNAREVALNYAARIVGCERPLPDEQLQYLYDGFRREKISETKAIIALGLSFGESLTLHADLEWIRVIDEYGEETCLSPPGLTYYISPISMIQRRLARDETIDIAQLCQDTVGTIQDEIAGGNIGAR